MNKVILVGGLGRDPELRYTQSQMSVANFSIATNHYNYKTKEKETVWHNCALWGKSAETFCKYAKKGTKVGVEGEITYEKFTDKQGFEKEKTVIKCFQSPELIYGQRTKEEIGEESTTMTNDGWGSNDNISDIPF